MLLGVQLYRNLLREARNLPDPRISQHYRDQIRSLFRREPVPESSLQAVRRVKQAQKILRQLQAANDGYLHAITRTIEHAYGVRGKGKHVGLQPFVATGTRDRSTRYSFPPPLAALVTSPVAHTARPPTPTQLLTPPTLPARADPASEDARLLGSLIPQRVRAIKRRYWNSQTGKLRAPIALRVQTDDTGDVLDPERAHKLLETYADVHVSPRAIAQGRERLTELVNKAATPTASRPLPPRRLQTAEQRAARTRATSRTLSPPATSAELRTFKPLSADTKWHLPKTITPRLLRRRMQEVLAQAPILEVKLASPKKEGVAPALKYGVTRHEAAKGEKGRYRPQTAEERWWQEQVNLAPPSSGPPKRRNNK
ncbi:hypothetical protein JCM3774_005657 [Rhodotorula dairenensis]